MVATGRVGSGAGELQNPSTVGTGNRPGRNNYHQRYQLACTQPDPHHHAPPAGNGSAGDRYGGAFASASYSQFHPVSQPSAARYRNPHDHRAPLPSSYFHAGNTGSARRLHLGIMDTTTGRCTDRADGSLSGHPLAGGARL